MVGMIHTRGGWCKFAIVTGAPGAGVAGRLRVFLRVLWKKTGCPIGTLNSERESGGEVCMMGVLKTRLLVPLLCIVLLALGLLGWMGWQLWQADRAAASERSQSLLVNRLQDFSRRLDEVIRAHERRLESMLEAVAVEGPEQWRQWALGDRVVRQVFVLDGHGGWLWPQPDDPGLSEREREFLRRAESLAGGGFAAAVGRRPGEDGELPDQGWRDWYHGDGRHWALWRTLGDRTLGDDDGVCGIELERMAFISDLIEALPFEEAVTELKVQVHRSRGGEVAESRGGDGVVDGEPAGAVDGVERVVYRLVDERGQVLHRWGGGVDAEDGDAGGEVLAWRELPLPLEGWRLEAMGDLQLLVGRGNRAFLVPLVSSLVAAGLVVVALAWFLWHQQRAELRQAEQRVNFVNQVSHELRTPLTNIGLYTELLQERLPEGDPRARHYSEVIGSEVGRLGRLIHNVLSFASRERGQAARLRPVETVPDKVVEQVLACFEPTLKQHGIEVQWKRGAGRPVALDRDALEQILSNLVSNVEKYAVGGRWLGIETAIEDGRLRLTVSDRGPGVAARDRERLFRPFVRLSDSVTEGVSGAGLGLGIVRELAAAHGGGVRCGAGPGGVGAVFEVELEIGVGSDESESIPARASESEPEEQTATA